MAVEKTEVLVIACDNPECAGNDLPTDDRTGWTFISTEVYGQPTEQHVYCCPMCAGTIAGVLDEQAAEPMPGMP